MPRDRKRKKSRTAAEDEFPEVPAAEDHFIGFRSCALLPAQRFDEPPPTFPVKKKIKKEEETDEVESDDSTETVIRGETNNIESIHTQNSIPIFPQTEPDSRNTQTNVSRLIAAHINVVDEVIKTISATNLSDDSRQCHVAEPRNELSDAQCSDKIMLKKIKSDPDSVSPPSTVLIINESSIKPPTGPDLSDLTSLSHNKSIEQVNSSCEQSINNGHLQKKIKNEPASPERKEPSHLKDAASPNNVMKFSTNSIDDTQSSPLKSPSFKSSLCDPNRKFSRDNEKFLFFNISFDLKDLRECIDYINTKYLSCPSKEITAPSNSSHNASCVPITDLKKEKDVTQISFCDNKITELSKTPEQVSGTSEAISNILNDTEMKTLFSENKHISLEKNQTQLPKSLSFFENSNSLKDTSKCLSYTKVSDKNGLNYEPMKVDSSKSYEKTFNKCIDKESASTSLSPEKLNKIIKKTESHFSPRSHESLTVTIDNHPVSHLQVEAVSSKRHASEEISVQKLQENNTFIGSERFKHSSFFKVISRKENPSLPKITHSANAKSSKHTILNHQTSKDFKEPSVKRIKIADYQNKHRTQPTSFAQHNTELIGETSSARSPLASCYSSSGKTPDRLHSYASPVLDRSNQHSDRNRRTGDMHLQSKAIPRDPRLHRSVSSITPHASPIASQTVSTRRIPSDQSFSKEVGIRKKISSSHVTGLSPRTYHHPEEAARNQKDHRLDSFVSSSSHSHTSNTPGSSRLPISRSTTAAPEIPTKTGKKAIPAQDVSFRIIAWNAKWLQEMHYESLPPICKQMKKVVQDTYENFDEYYETYYGLHLISIWLDVLRSWKGQPLSFCAEFESCEERTYHFKNRCSATMPAVDMPINQGIIHITCKAENGESQLLLGFVYHVEQRLIVDGDLSWRDVKFHFYTVECLKAKRKSPVYIRKLSRLRVAIKQLTSLESLRASPLEKILVNPRNHARKINIVKIPSTVTPGTELEDIVNKIIKSATSPDNRFTLVEQPPDADTLTILSLIRQFVPKRSTVLVCLRDTDRCFQIAELLSFGFVLALKESEVLNIPEKFKGFTLRSEAFKKYKDSSLPVNSEAAELNVLKTAKIILTVTSRIFLGDNKNATLGQKLTVIIEHSSMCTELETALPLSYGPENIVLLGFPKDSLSLNAHLYLRDYQKSLFHRLHEAKTMSENEHVNYSSGS